MAAEEYHTAVHEAAHAVMLIRRGRRFALVSIEPDGETDSKGHTLTLDMELKPDDETHLVMDPLKRQEIEDQIVAAFAGPAAERHARSDDMSHSEGDKQRVVRLAALLFGEHQAAERDHYMAYLDAVAERLVLEDWLAIDRVARELIDRRTMSPAEVIAAAQSGPGDLDLEG